MGLLDAIRYSTGDPDRDAQLNRGLLAAGLQLMQAKGRNLLGAIGEAGGAGLLAADNTAQQQQQRKRAGMQDQLMRYQIGEAERAQKLADLPQQFYRAPSQPGIDATGGMETALEAPNNAASPQGRFDMPGYVQALYGANPLQAMQLLASMAKAPAKLETMKKDEVGFVWNPATQKYEEAVRGVAGEPDGEKDAFLRLMKAAGIDTATPAGRKLLESYLQKQATHAPPVTLNNFGSPLPIQLPGGGEGYIQPPTRPGGPSQVLTLPGTTTPAQKPGGNLTEGQAKANLFGTRAKEADKIITGLAARGVQSPSLPQQVTGGEGMTGALATAFATPEQQQVDQAQRDFINAALRRESGAVISPADFANARMQYFVQPGDSPQVIQQKARNRQVAIAGILAEVPEGRRGVALPPEGGAAPKPTVSNW